ncbi:MAG: glycosyltransferase involved in cell wall biosynthesis [Arenicella sp.]|jgi:glycosyltransferase involved in cell wall biosynthesis
MFDKADRLKVLHVIPSVAACRGGPSKAVVEMVLSLRTLGIDAEIATTNDNGPNNLEVSLNSLIDHSGVPVRFFERASPPIAAIREFSYSLSFTRWLSRHISDYDVVHVHAIFSYCSSYAMYLARKKGIPYVVRPIGQLQNWSLQQARTKKKLYLQVLEKANIESASAVHFTADAEQREANLKFSLLGHVIPLGIDIPAPATLSKQQLFDHLAIAENSSAITVLYLSRLHQKKGLELLMQALSNIKDSDYSLFIAGDGDDAYKSKLGALSHLLKIADKCIFLGHVDGHIKTALFSHSDLYALTSYSENFGISVLESMAAGLTPIITDGVALSNIVGENQLGYICTADVDAIEATLRSAFANRKELTTMGEKARGYTQANYSWSSIAKQLESLYLSIIVADKPVDSA